MPRYKLRTLLIVLAVMPPLLWLVWGRYQAWKAEQDRRAALLRVVSALSAMDYSWTVQIWPLPSPAGTTTPSEDPADVRPTHSPSKDYRP